MSAQAQMEEIRRLSGEHRTALPPAPAPERPSTKRVAVAMLLAALLAVGLLHSVLTKRFAAQTDARADRAAMIAARAAADVASSFGGEGDALRAAMAAWQKEHPNVSAVRVVNIENRSFEASSFAEDIKEGEIPRQMQRPEKALYDLGQEIRADVETNVSEGAKREDEVAVSRESGAILVAAPIEKDGAVVGFVQVKGRPEIVAVEAPSFWFALAFAIAPFVVVLALSFVLRREMLLVIIACALLIMTLFAYRQWAMRTLEGGARAAEARFTERVLRESTIVARIAPGTQAKAASWDADKHRVPLKIDPARAVAGEKDSVANASYGIGLLSLLLLLFVGTTAASRTASSLSTNRQAYFFVLPAMIGMLLLVFFPFLYGIAVSFTSQTIYNVNKPYAEVFVGFQNYLEILGDFDLRGPAGINFENFYWTFFFTVVWTVTNVTIGVTVGLLLALILNVKDLRFKALYRVLLVLPWAMPNYITSLIWKGMFHQQFGVINQVIQLFGGEPIAWFERPFTSFCAVIATNGWLSFPFMMVVSLGALQSIPGDLYEAARVDGASRWQQFRSITLPSLKPALVPAIILSVVWTFNMFNIIYLVSAGEPAHSTEILTTQAYKIAFEQYRYGYAAAYSTVIFAILLIYGVFQNRVSRATEAIAS
ncbi:MAG TPA: sugar ABC transporter permease [Thermoanaerobaculia bacterium]|jgi:arabinogalactan oligomer/maltooligosaccharide transport system permease protein